jgi:prolyl-tRNA synthetase
LIGAVILTHGDDKGLRLPPRIAPIQVVIIPITKNEDQANQLKTYLNPMTEALRSSGVRIFEDWTNNSPGFKFNEWEMKGVPLRMEVGPRDIKEEKVVLVRRDSKEKLFISKDSVLENIQELLEDIQENLLRQARDFRDENTHAVQDYTEFKEVIKQGGFVRCGWNGDSKVEAKIKEETKATVRCIPFNENPQGLTCIKTGEEAKHEVIFAKAY